eukprot:11193944-Lingulodinium_polyedra.AAC.1
MTATNHSPSSLMTASPPGTAIVLLNLHLVCWKPQILTPASSSCLRQPTRTAGDAKDNAL